MPKETKTPTPSQVFTASVNEQRVIETLADKEKRLAIELIAALKEYMLSKSELSFTAWLALVLKEANKRMNKAGVETVNQVLNTSYELNKLDRMAVTNAGKVDSKEIAKKQKITGKTTETNMRNLIRTSLTLLGSEATRFKAQGLTNVQLTQSLMGVKTQQYKNGSLVRYINGVRTYSTTNTKAAAEAIRQVRYDRDNSVQGYQWVSLLDSVTSLTCQGLNGKLFYFFRVVNGKRVPLSGYKPLPPIHQNCRSSTQPIYVGIKPTPIMTFDEWALKNKVAAEEAMGPTRYALWKSGTVQIRRFTDARFRPLTLEQLVVKQPLAVSKVRTQEKVKRLDIRDLL